jgi:Flp pilus assembly protein TadD
MSRFKIERGRRSTLALLAAVAIVVLTGCASTAPAGAPATNPAGKSAKTKPVAEAPVLPAEKDRARVQVDGGLGFTVTEVVHIGSDVRSDYQQAVAMLQQGRLVEGIALLEGVVARAPGLTAPHVDLGVAYGRNAQWDKAEKSLEAALALAPDHPAALNEIGIVYRRTGRFDAARSSYEHALRVHPTYHYALRNLGVLCDLYLEDLPCALDAYRRYAELVPDDAQVGVWIADLSARMGVATQE